MREKIVRVLRIIGEDIVREALGRGNARHLGGFVTTFTTVRLPNDEADSEDPAVGLPLGSRSEVAKLRRPSGCV